MNKYFFAVLASSILMNFEILAPFADASTNGSCISTLGLGVIPNGGTAYGYSMTISLPGTPCALKSVKCLNGVLSGPDLYPNCSDILQDCNGIPNGGSVSGFISPYPPCNPMTVTCTNGSLSGPLPFPNCTEYQ